MNRRQHEFADLVREFVISDAAGEPCHITLLYDVAVDRRPDLVDDERRNPPYERTLRWHHDLQWALKNLVLDAHSGDRSTT